MNRALVQEIDAKLSARGWRYNIESELFESGDGGPIDPLDVIAALPELSFDELAAYEETKQRRQPRTHYRPFHATPRDSLAELAALTIPRPSLLVDSAPSPGRNPQSDGGFFIRMP